MDTPCVDVDQEADSLLRDIERDKRNQSGTAALVAIEKLRRLEHLARCAGGSRQTFQKILSARRILGDSADLGSAAAFSQGPAANVIRPAPDALSVPNYLRQL